MELLGLDAGFRPVKALRCINMQWNRRYYEPGDFTLQLCMDDFDTAIAYIYTTERPEVGRVEKLETEHNIKGDFVQVSGYFLEGMLNWKVIYPRYRSVGNLTAACRALVRTYLADAEVAVAEGLLLGQDEVFDAVGVPLGDTTYGLLKTQEMSQRIQLDYETGHLHYEVWQGADRTQSQHTRPYAVFSQDLGTADTVIVTIDESAYRNYAIAAYEDGTLTVDIRTDASQPQRVLYVDTGMAPEDGQSQSNFLDAVRTYAKTDLAACARVINVEATVVQRSLRYLLDYDIGDRCDVRDDRLNMAFEARIIEVNEVWKQNTHEVSLQFGDKIPV